MRRCTSGIIGWAPFELEPDHHGKVAVDETKVRVEDREVFIRAVVE